MNSIEILMVTDISFRRSYSYILQQNIIIKKKKINYMNSLPISTIGIQTAGVRILIFSCFQFSSLRTGQPTDIR